MKPDLPKSTVYTELDALLDTRMGTLLRMNEHKFTKLLATGYHERIKDEFEGFDMAEYWRLYEARDVQTLKRSQFTGVINALYGFVEKTLQKTLRTPFHSEPKIQINTYPYQLSESEISLMARAIAYHTHQHADVEMVYRTPEQLNPVYVREHYSTMFMYDGPAWIELNAQAGYWNKYICPQVSICTPLLITNRDTNVSGMSKATVIADLDKLSQVFEPFVQVVFAPVEEFSWVINPHKVPEPTTPDTPDEGGVRSD